MSEPNASKTDTHDTSVEVDLLLWWEDYYLPIFEYILPQMGDLQGKRVLELGTGTGGTATILAKRGAYVTGIDLLPFRLVEARQRTLQHSVTNATDFLLMDATELAFPDNTFDIIISKSVLVFTDHAEVSRECHRVLKPGGKAIFIENMRHHPVVWLYRKLFLKYSRELRYFSLADIRAIGENFTEMEHREFHLMSLGALFWKRCIPIPVLYRWTLKLLKSVDNLIIRYIPMLNYFCWISAMICRK